MRYSTRYAPNMTYQVEISRRAERDLRQICHYIRAEHSSEATAWFNGLAAVIASLDQLPDRGSVTPEAEGFRELLYGRSPRAYRIIYGIDETRRVVNVAHVRHGARDRFKPTGNG